MVSASGELSSMGTKSVVICVGSGMGKTKTLTIQQRIKAVHSWEDDMLDKHGYYIHVVPSGDPQTKTEFNAHTHGLPEHHGHADLQIILPLPSDVVSGVFRSAVDAIKSGTVFLPTQRYSEIIENYDVSFIEATESGRRVLRMILPDKSGELDEEKLEGHYSLQF